MRLLAALLATLGFLRGAIPRLGSHVRSRSLANRRAGLELVTRCLQPGRGVDAAGLSRSWGILGAFAMLSDPGRSCGQGHFSPQTRPPLKPRRRQPALPISRLYCTALALAVYASQCRVAPAPRKTRFRLPASSTGRDFHPGFQRKFHACSLHPILLSQVQRDARLEPAGRIGRLVERGGPHSVPGREARSTASIVYRFPAARGRRAFHALAGLRRSLARFCMPRLRHWPARWPAVSYGSWYWLATRLDVARRPAAVGRGLGWG